MATIPPCEIKKGYEDFYCDGTEPTIPPAYPHDTPTIPPPEQELKGTGTNIKGTNGAQKRARPADPLFDAIAEVCKVDPKTAGASIGKVRAVLSKAGYSPDEVRKFGALENWRRTAPTLWQLQEKIGVVRAAAQQQAATFKDRE